MALLPAFGERNVPVRVRLAVTAAFTAVVAPAVAPAIGEEHLAAGLGSAAGEIAVGLALGIAFRLLVLVLQIAGTIAANMTSLSQILGGIGVDPQPAFANALVVGGLALAALSGLHLKVAIAIIQSYDVFPAGQMPLSGDLAEWGVRQVSAAFSLGFTLAAPFTIASLIYNLALGAINRAMPQLMVAFVGAPAITGGALFLLAVTAPLVLAIWTQALDAVLADPFGTGK